MLFQDVMQDFFQIDLYQRVLTGFVMCYTAYYLINFEIPSCKTIIGTFHNTLFIRNLLLFTTLCE